MTVTYGRIWCTFCSKFSGVTASNFRSSDDNEVLDSSSAIGAAFVMCIPHENRTLDDGVDPPFHRDEPILLHYTSTQPYHTNTTFDPKVCQYCRPYVDLQLRVSNLKVHAPILMTFG